MATTMATMLNTKCLTTNPHKSLTNPSPKTPTKPYLPMQTLPKGLRAALSSENAALSTALAGTIFSTLATCDAAFAAQQVVELAEASSDNRGLALLLPIVPAIAWVLFNILQPALNQINKMRSTKGVIVGLGLGLGGMAALGFMQPPVAAAASEIATLADVASDNRGQLLLIVVTPAILWVLYNILQPALNQINRMRS